MLDPKFVTERVNVNCDLVENNTKVKISPGARRLIAVVVRLTGEDPHPNWARKDNPQALQEMLIQRLPEILANVTRGIRAPDGTLLSTPLLNEINTFDLLHQMTVITDLLCPFKKR
jgi:hypothetical protein